MTKSTAHGAGGCAPPVLSERLEKDRELDQVTARAERHAGVNLAYTIGMAPSLAQLAPHARQLVDALDSALPSRARAFARDEIPEWAGWLATDADGSVWAYNLLPLLHEGAHAWRAAHSLGRLHLVDNVGPCAAWRESLVRLPRAPDGSLAKAGQVYLVDAPPPEWHAVALMLGVLLLAVLTALLGDALGWWGHVATWLRVL